MRVCVGYNLIQVYTHVQGREREIERERDLDSEAYLLVVRGWALATAVPSASDTWQLCLCRRAQGVSLTIALMSVLSGPGPPSA